ncbi:hypothetical protein BJ912DRAFT_1141235 [Pholiota molesta]|nr:hypothetical protein BJ912DRAFT_1141235 [Pholiota molesta]
MYTDGKTGRAIVDDLLFEFTIKGNSATLKYCDGCALERRKAGKVDEEQPKAVASAARDVCNATFALLFTLALFIWGLLKNHRQA